VTTAIIVDDERLARRELAGLLRAHPELTLAGEAASVDEAAELVRRVDPDVVFLDIQMPRRSGFELLEAAEVRGRIVFVTAHDVHALRAFEVNALDYLLKPVHPARLAVTVGRLLAPPPTSAAWSAAAALPPGGAAEAVAHLAAPPPPLATSPLELDDHLFLSEGRAARFVRVRSIVCIRGAGDYSELVLADGKQLLSPRPLKEWEARLPAHSFARVHRTAIANLEHVETVERISEQTFHVKLRGLAEPVPLSRRHAARLRSLG
jgi:two-component system LytT family response regulator